MQLGTRSEECLAAAVRGGRRRRRGRGAVEQRLTGCEGVTHSLQVPNEGHGFFVPYLGLLYTTNTVQQQRDPHHCLGDSHGTPGGEGEGESSMRDSGSNLVAHSGVQ
jgi:hypothetical protein